MDNKIPIVNIINLEKVDNQKGGSNIVDKFFVFVINMLFKELALRPILSSIRNVRVSVCLSVPFPCDFQRIDPWPILS